MSTTFSLRYYNPEKDLHSLHQMLTEIESIDRDGEDTSEEYLESMKGWVNFDPDKNTWLVESDGNFVGFGQILPKSENQCSIYVAVHPTRRRQGIGSELLKRIFARTAETGSKTALVYANGKNTASIAFLQHHGFELVGTSGVLFAQVSDLPQAELPTGYSFRRLPELADRQLVVQALNDCYKDMVGHHQNVTSADRYVDYYGEEGSHLFFNADDQLVGICAGRPEGKTDEPGISNLLDAPGLIKEHRHKGYQKILLLTVMNWLRQKNQYPFTLEYWGDDEDALAIYRSLGFEMTNQLMTYHKELK
jgi:mycothiol synthase